MKVLVSGANGMVGKALQKRLEKEGWKMSRMVRKAAASPDEIEWDPGEGKIDVDKMEGFDAIVHLSGDNLASGRWNEEKKRQIRDSRIGSALLLSTAMQELDEKPEVFISASAVGYYGNRGDEIMTENSKPGEDFLAWVCRDWERAVDPAMVAGVRVANLRIGMVLSNKGGALKKMLPGFVAGVAGNLGSGNQFTSWIDINDLVNIIIFVIKNKELSGPINCVAPEPVRNSVFTKTMGKVLSRPTFISVPPSALRLVFGEMADAAILSSTRVMPAKLQAAGYEFLYPTLEESLTRQLKRQ